MEKIIIILIIPIISALIGWFTNYIAIKSLFRPIKPVNFLGMKIQGVIPKRKKALAKNISEVVEEHLFSHTDIAEKLLTEDNLKKIKLELAPVLENKILEKVPGMFRMIAEPIIKKMLDEEMESIVIEIVEKLNGNLVELVDIKGIIREKIETYNTENLENIIFKIASNEFKHIEYLGGVIGFVVGLFQVGLMLVI